MEEGSRRISDEVRGDRHGNSFAVVNSGGDPKIMIAGHTDEIGLMVSQITEEGYLFFTTVGGWDNQVLPGQRVRLLGRSGIVTGVIGRKPIHLMKKEDREDARGT